MNVGRVALTATAVLMFGLVCGGDCTDDLTEVLFGGPADNGQTEQPDAAGPDDGEAAEATFPRVRITVEYTPVDAKGERKRANFIIELNDELAPLSTANFLAYVDAGFYDGTVFHRVDRSLGVVQGGGFEVEADEEREEDEEEDVTSRPLVEKPPLFDPVEHEASNGLLNLRGTVGVARTADPDSGTSQWYVNTEDNPELDPKAGDAGFTVFGRVVGGLSIVDEMQQVEVEERNDLVNVPVETIQLIRATRMGSAQDEPADEPVDESEESGKPRVVVSVQYLGQDGNLHDGRFTIELEDELAPISTANFLAYVDAGFYDNTVIHRVDRSLGVIQGGGFEVDPSELDMPPVSRSLVLKEPLFDPIKNEADNGLLNVRGSVGVARTSDPDSGTSQWYVNTVDNPGLDPEGNPPGFAVFGTVVDGMEVVDAIQLVAVEPRGGLENVPIGTTLIKSIERLE